MCVCVCVCAQLYHYQALVCPEDVPALVASSCRCKGQCECDPANHLFYNLSVGSGPSRQRFARQRKAIAAELEHSRWTRLLADMPYHVRTVAPKASCPQPVDARLAPSNLQTSGQSVLLGVFPTHGQPPITAALTQSTAEQARRARSVTWLGVGGPPSLAHTLFLLVQSGGPPSRNDFADC